MQSLRDAEEMIRELEEAAANVPAPTAVMAAPVHAAEPQLIPKPVGAFNLFTALNLSKSEYSAIQVCQ